MRKKDTGIIKQILTYAPGSVIPAVITLVTSSIFTRHFNAETYGVYSLFFIVATTFRLLSSMWLHQSIGRFLPPENTESGQKRIKNIIMLSLWIIFCVEMAATVIVIAFLKSHFSTDTNSFFTPVIVFVVVTSLFDVFNMIFSAEQKARQYVSYKLTDSLVTFGLRVVLVFVVVKMNVDVMFWSVVISNAALIPIMWFKTGLPSPLGFFGEFKDRENRKLVMTFFAYGFPMTLWYFASILLDVGDRYIVDFYLGPAAVGIYDANYRLINGGVSLIVMPVTLTLHPYLMSIAGTAGNERIGGVIEVIIENLLCLGCLAVGLMFVFHRDVAFLVLGEEFRQGSLVMPLVLAGIICFNIGTFAHKPFEIKNKTMVMLIFAAAAAVLNIAANFVLIPIVGYVGAAYATLIAFFAYTVCVGLLGRNLISWRMDLTRVFKRIAFLSAVIYAIFLIRRFLEARLSYAAGLCVSLVLASILSGFYMLKLFKESAAVVKKDAA